MKKLLLACSILSAGLIAEAQPTINFINTTSCNVWQDFYCRDGSTCAGPVVNTGGLVVGPGTTSYDASVLYGSTLPTGHAWLYGRIGDDNANCSFQASGSGCTQNFFLTISNGVCTPGVTAGCFNADTAPTCNTCGVSQIKVWTVYYPNGDLDVIIN